MLCWHWLFIYTSSVAFKQAIIKQFGKTLARKNVSPIWCYIPVHRSSSVTLLCWETRCQCILVRLTEQNRWSLWQSKTKRIIACTPMYQQWTTYVILCYSMCTSAVRDSRLAHDEPFRVHRHALQSEGRIILNYSNFIQFRVYFHPYYYITLGFKSLDLVMALFSNHSTYPCFWESFHLYAFTVTHANVVITSTCHLTGGLESVYCKMWETQLRWASMKTAFWG